MDKDTHWQELGHTHSNKLEYLLYGPSLEYRASGKNSPVTEITYPMPTNKVMDGTLFQAHSVAISWFEVFGNSALGWGIKTKVQHLRELLLLCQLLLRYYNSGVRPPIHS